MKTRKFNHLFVIQGAYGQGWEDVSAYDYPKERKEARSDLRAYRENEPQYRHRMIRRRERNEVAA